MAEPSGGRRGLGRGLSALLDEADAPLVVEAPPGEAVIGLAGVREAPIELLRRNPDQPRRFFDEEALEELAESVRQKGLLQPILVRPAPGAPGEFQIVAGERRWRAAQRANLHVVPIVVRELDDLDVLEIGIIENVQRVDLNPLEEAQSYKILMDRFGRTQDMIAQSVGKSRSHVANILRLLSLPDTVREHLTAGRLTSGHARAIASAPEPGRLAEMIVDRGLSVRQAEALAREAQDRPDSAVRKPVKAPAYKDPNIAALEQDLGDVLGYVVEIIAADERGEVRVKFESIEQLDDICRRLSQLEPRLP
jgi:ParB family transcriptional regulator, chromosome partitioning protein